jgi:hypothetical protein
MMLSFLQFVALPQAFLTVTDAFRSVNNAKSRLLSRNPFLLTRFIAMNEFSIPNQPQRFARAKEVKNSRFLDIDSVYRPDYLKGKTGAVLIWSELATLILSYLLVLITGGSRGLGRAITDELTKQGSRYSLLCFPLNFQIFNLGAHVIVTARSPIEIPGVIVVDGIEVTVMNIS